MAGPGVCVCLCVHARLRARGQLRHGRRWLPQQGERRVCNPLFAAERGDFLLLLGARVGLGMCAPPAVVRSLTLLWPRVCDDGAGVCIWLCVRARLRAWVQLRHGRRWRRQHRERLVSPRPPSRARVVPLCSSLGTRVGLGTESVRAPPSAGQSLTQSRTLVCDGCAGVCFCLCVRARLRARAQFRNGRRWLPQHGEGNVSPFPSQPIGVTFRSWLGCARRPGH
jgi:hypothetical protein